MKHKVTLQSLLNFPLVLAFVQANVFRVQNSFSLGQLLSPRDNFIPLDSFWLNSYFVLCYSISLQFSFCSSSLCQKLICFTNWQIYYVTQQKIFVSVSPKFCPPAVSLWMYFGLYFCTICAENRSLGKWLALWQAWRYACFSGNSCISCPL